MIIFVTFDKKRTLLEEAYDELKRLKINTGFILPSVMPEVSREGKPRFINSDIGFSVTHTKGLCAVAFSKSEVGIDAEAHRKINFNRFKRIIEAESEKEFFDKWTKLEAYLKYTGEGLKDISKKIPPEAPVKNLEIMSGYSFAVCGEGEITIKIF
ncbi:MAG: hypothetical protein GX891_03220 [Clostridiales bacterium]|nr:hypothetical protein [Clostridiales bacterium]